LVGLVVGGEPPFALKMRTSASTAATAAAAAIAGDPNAGEPTLNYVIMAVLKQPMDGNLAQALDKGGISEIFYLLPLSQADCDSLTFLDATTALTHQRVCSTVMKPYTLTIMKRCNSNPNLTLFSPPWQICLK